MGLTARWRVYTVTLTDIFAFIIGSNTTLPALRNFCFYAAFGILFTFFFQVTWFVAWLTVDEWRRASNRRDIACCLTVPKEACCACCAPRADGRTKMGAWMGQTMGGALTKPAVKYGVLAFFAAIAAGGFAGCAMMQIEADVNDFIPGGSYLKEWIADSNSLFGKLGDPIYVYSRDLDVSTAEGAALMITASDAFKADPYVAETSVESWIETFNAVRGSTGAFTNADLYAFVNGAGIAYKGDIVWKNESGTAPAEGVASTRMRGNHIKSGSSNGKVASMDSLRDSLSSVENNDGEVFAYWPPYQLPAVQGGQGGGSNLSSTMAVMVVIIAFLIVAPRAVLGRACLCLIIVNIIGYMHFDLTDPSPSSCSSSRRSSVDTRDIARAYMEHEGTPDERLKPCLDTGVAAQRRDNHVPRRCSAAAVARLRKIFRQLPVHRFCPRRLVLFRAHAFANRLRSGRAITASPNDEPSTRGARTTHHRPASRLPRVVLSIVKSHYFRDIEYIQDVHTYRSRISTFSNASGNGSRPLASRRLREVQVRRAPRRARESDEQMDLACG